MERLLRIGRVSSIDYGTGMMSLTYPQYDNATTAKMPLFAFAGEYKMPAIGQNMLAMHFASGSAAGIVLGQIWNEASPCPGVRPGVWRHELGPEPGEAFMEYDPETKTLTISAPNIVLQGSVSQGG